MNIINVGATELRELTEQLNTAYTNYQKSYAALEEGLTTLTSRGFTGDVAPVLMNTFNTKVKPNGEAMREVVKKAITTMEEQTIKFNRASDDMVSIARQ